MCKTLRILCFVTVFLIPACAEQSEVTVEMPHPTTTTSILDHAPPTAPSTTTTILKLKTKSMSKASTSRVVSSLAASNDVWDVLAKCESHGNWSYKGVYEGGLQFAPSTWSDYVAEGKPYGLIGYPVHAYDATREQQIVVAIRVRDGIKESSDPFLNAQGWGAWPTCRYEAGV